MSDTSTTETGKTPSSAANGLQDRGKLVERLNAVVPYQGKSVVAFLCHEAAERIAADSDLLAALEEAAEFIQPFNRAEDLLDRMEAAIAKAKGLAA